MSKKPDSHRFGRVVPRERGEGYRIDLHPFKPRYVYAVSGQTFASEEQAQWLLDGLRYEVNVLGKPPELALARFLSPKAKPNRVPARYAQWLRMQHERAAAGELSPTSLRSYGRYENEVAARFASLTVREVTTPTLEDWARAIMAGGRSPKTARNMVGALLTCLRWCRSRGHLQHVPDFPRIKPGKRKRPPRLSAAEQTRLLLEIDEASRGVFLALALLGLRTGEGRGLQVSDVDLQREAVTVQHALKGSSAGSPLGPTKTSTQRELPLPRPLAKWLADYMPAAEGFAFLNPATGGPWSHKAVRDRWIAAGLAAEIPKARLHLYGNTRHSYAVTHAERGTDPRHLQALMGHASFGTTMKHYLEFSADALRKTLPEEG